jgi:hypothetical protein
MIGVFLTYYVCFMIRIPEGLVGIRSERCKVGPSSERSSEGGDVLRFGGVESGSSGLDG